MPKKEELDKEIYNKFVQSVDIQSMNLINLNIENLNNDVDRSERLFVDLEFENNTFNVKGDFFKVNPKFYIKVSYKKDNDECILFKIRFEYQLEYIIEDLKEFDTNYLELFVKRNVPVNIWPYARELISSMTTRMGYPALIIEPLKV